MMVRVLTKSACSYGGNTTYTLAGDYLQNGLKEYGPAIREFEILTCFRGIRREVHSSLLPSIERFHTTLLPSLPTAKLFRKKARVVLEYETSIVDATFLERYGFLSADIFSQVLREIAEKIHLIDVHLKKVDAFDLARFHSDVVRLAENSPKSDDDLRTLHIRIQTEKKQRIAAMDPWDRMAIEWDQFHPTARSLLNDTFFWELCNDYAPHGNDTGADLLSDFQKWNKRHPDQPAYQMARTLLREWNIAEIGYPPEHKTAIPSLLQSNSIALAVTDDVMIAAAFAAVKCRGCCDSETRDLALNAIARQRLPEVITDRGWKDPAERIAKLDLMASALRRFPESPT